MNALFHLRITILGDFFILFESNRKFFKASVPLNIGGTPQDHSSLLMTINLSFIIKFSNSNIEFGKLNTEFENSPIEIQLFSAKAK